MAQWHLIQPDELFQGVCEGQIYKLLCTDDPLEEPRLVALGKSLSRLIVTEKMLRQLPQAPQPFLI